MFNNLKQDSRLMLEDKDLLIDVFEEVRALEILEHILTMKFKPFETLYLKKQFYCFYEEPPEPKKIKKRIMLDGNEIEYFKWLRRKIIAMLYNAPSSRDPRFDPCVIYNTVVELQKIFINFKIVP